LGSRVGIKTPSSLKPDWGELDYRVIDLPTGGGFAAIAPRLLVAATAGVQTVEWDTAALLTGAVLAGTACVPAALGPSSRAARVDPNAVLRAD
jgi:hypothetical protein